MGAYVEAGMCGVTSHKKTVTFKIEHKENILKMRVSLQRGKQAVVVRTRNLHLLSPSKVLAYHWATN